MVARASPSASCAAAKTIADGGGTKNAGTWSARTAIYQSARERGAHAHAAGELRRVAGDGVGETDVGERLARGLLALFARSPSELERERDVGEHVAPREQVRVLKDIGERAPIRRGSLL